MAYELSEVGGRSYVRIEMAASLPLERVVEYALAVLKREQQMDEDKLTAFERLYPNRRALMIAVKDYALEVGVADMTRCLMHHEDRAELERRVKGFWS